MYWLPRDGSEASRQNHSYRVDVVVSFCYSASNSISLRPPFCMNDKIFENPARERHRYHNVGAQNSPPQTRLSNCDTTTQDVIQSALQVELSLFEGAHNIVIPHSLYQQSAHGFDGTMARQDMGSLPQIALSCCRGVQYGFQIRARWIATPQTP